ncbi:ERAD-associated protein [Podospora pseudopauciseta]|uniref:ERAD-associated protein n=1 Tax=Podospora pseudopauciseta TaxID=2093780 RepID=A0ABR0HYB9_9PEZI|nr:ERAD-associated protein [Podospora pseudopauciseta]
MMRYFLWLFLLLQALAFSYAEAQADQHVLTGDSAKPKQVDDDGFRPDMASAPSGGQQPGMDSWTYKGAKNQETTDKQPGAELVHSAMTELRKLYQPLHHKAKRHQGVVSLILNFALKAVPTLRLTAPPAETSQPTPGLSGPLLHASKLLNEAARQNNSDALYILAEVNFYGNFSHPRNFKEAFDNYHKLALLNGNNSALYMMGLMYSTGIGGAVEADQARALLYYTFAANRGHTRAQMSLAYRHHAGIGTPKNCDVAVKYYKQVADKVIAWYRSGPPGGMRWVDEAHRIADELGGVYGEGASAYSAGRESVQKSPDSYASIEDIIEYLNLMSEKGDFKASFNLGRIYYEGQRGHEINLAEAKRYFYEVAQQYWVKGQQVQNPKPGLDKYAAKAAGYIGRMYMRGEGVDQNFIRAKYWFERGSYLKDSQSQYSLGLLYLNGYGVPVDVPKATEYFKAAAMQDYPYAEVALGALHLDQGGTDDLAAANHYFELAARWASIESYYYLGELNLLGVGREKSCSAALGYFKSVSERAEPFVSSWAEANLAYDDGDEELALLEYLGAAEQGYEKAQNNVAFMLDPEQSLLEIPQWLYRRAVKSPLLRNPRLALTYWTRSARQGNIDSLVKMGDYYLHGIGAEPDVDKALQCYQGASEYQQSAQAMYNLGWMHEHGVGLQQDYHLAKRHYDAAYEINEEAYLPVSLSLLKLRAKSAWNTFTNGAINSIRDEPVEKKHWSLREWINNFLQEENAAGQLYDDYYSDEYYDEAAAGQNGAGQMPGGDGPDFDEDGVLDSLIIMGLVVSLAFLLFYRAQRQQRQEEARRREQEGGNIQPQQQPPPAGAAQAPFPQLGQPGFGGWGAGGWSLTREGLVVPGLKEYH